MFVRVLVAAIVSMALAFAGASHAMPVAAPSDMAVVEAPAPDGHGDHAGHNDHADRENVSGAPDDSGNRCADADHCLGCSAHCPAIALIETHPVPSLPTPGARFLLRGERGKAGPVLNAERPPEAI